ncbi:MAG: glutamate-5-semialdehyde dehydrogenase [Lachnospiraceae bacterium]|nr:glutamate-5-semialdehyde dehydrogenase [Lachnospiraceae bacterium]
MTIREIAQEMKLTAPKMAATTLEERNHALAMIAEGLQEHVDEIYAANAEDVKVAEENGVAPSVMKRLKFNESKMKDAIAGLELLQTLEDPVGKVQLKRQLDEGLILTRVSCPIGVIGVIFEARPDAMIQVSSLCIKSGNCAILKGGKETAKTNRVIFQIIKDSVIKAGMPEGCLFQAELHNEIDELLECDQYVDLLIPRGSNKFVRYIMDHTKIPVMGHADGICHIYVDENYDEAKAIPIIKDAKIQYTAACNAVETLLVNRKIAKHFLPKLAEALKAEHVKVRGTKEVLEILKDAELMGEDEFNTEYLDLILSVKLVEGVEEAVDHINRFGSHHTDCIITEDAKTAEYFMQMVDSAGVYQNCSTRFADGFRYGFGAEVGISTGKIHARGPVGLEGLVTYKYRLQGSGQIVGDYASGKSQFHFKNLQ